MSNTKLSDVRIFNDQVFRSKFTHRRDKILMSIQDPERCVLKPDDEEYKNLLVQALSIMSEPNRSTSKIIRLIVALGVSEKHAYNVKKDAEYVFGEIMQVNRLFEKAGRREYLKKVIRKLEDAPRPDYKLILEANKQLIMLDDLPKAHAGAQEDEGEDLVIPKVTFTSDPRSLIEEAQIADEEE